MVKIKRQLSQSLLMQILCLYIFFLYTAQDTLFPPVIHSLVTYSLIFITGLSVFIDGKVDLSTHTRWYACLTIICLLSMSYAESFTGGSLYTMVVILIITFCFSYIIRSFHDLNKIIYVFILSADVLGVLSYAASSSGGSSDRLGESATGNANIFSALLMVAAVFSIWMFVFFQKKKDKIFSGLSSVLLLILMALSGGRKTIIAVLLCFTWFWVCKEGKINVKLLKNVIIVIFSIFIMYYAVTTIPFLYNAIGERFEGLFSMFSGDKSSVSSDGLRERMIEIGIEGWKKKPLLGHGLDNFRFYNARITGRTFYAHNNYVELLYDLGLLGFLLYYIYEISIVSKIRNITEIDFKYKGLCIGLILELLVFDIGGVAFYQVLPQIVLCMAASIISIAKNESEEQTEEC